MRATSPGGTTTTARRRPRSQRERHRDLDERERERLSLSPIIHWSADDVFEYLRCASAGMIETYYSDFSATLQFYRDAGGSFCAVVGDMRMQEAAGLGLLRLRDFSLAR